MPKLLAFLSRTLFSFYILFLLAMVAPAQTPVSDFRDVISSKDVTLHDVSGNGSSTGSALTGYLVNRTDRKIAINVNLREPQFFINSGPRQNMFALQVYEKDGGYFSNSEHSFIIIEPRGRLDIVFNALCADFERGNPTSADSFKLGGTAAELRTVLSNIAEHYRTKPDRDDLLSASQAALWMTQGVSLTEIRKRFEVSTAQEQLALDIVESENNVESGQLFASVSSKM